MNKILYIMTFAICFNLYASDSEGDYSSSRDSGTGELIIPNTSEPQEIVGPDGFTTIRLGHCDEGAEASEMPPAPDAPSSSNAPVIPARPGSLVISEPQPSKYPDLTKMAALVKQIPNHGPMLAPIRVTFAVNYANNRSDISVPREAGLLEMFRLAGRKNTHGRVSVAGIRKPIDRIIPCISGEITDYNLETATQRLWNVGKTHGSLYVLHYCVPGLFAYQVDADGRFTHQTRLLPPSDRERNLVLVIESGKVPGISLLEESQLPAARKSVTSAPKAIVAKPRK